MPKTPTVEITYCRLCGWGLRAGWMAQELMHTFAEELGTVMLTPDTTGGVFEVRVDGALVFSRQETGHIPDIKELKRLVRDRIAPDRSLGARGPQLAATRLATPPYLYLAALMNWLKASHHTTTVV